MSGKASNPFTATGGFISRRDTNWCESDDDVWFAGENGIVMHWTPTGYTEYDTGVTETLRSI